MTERVRLRLFTAAVCLLSVALSYGLALAGDPRPHWIWCQILKVC